MRKIINNKKGITLPEVLTVIVIVVILTVASIPALDAFFDSMVSRGSAEAMINAALSSARAMATSEHRYVGIRFQNIYDERGPLYADQYMIFIISDTVLGANAFRAVTGMKPIRLPDNFGVMDLYLVLDRNIQNPVNPLQEPIRDDEQINEEEELLDTSTFSVIFSPSGKMVVHGLYVKNENDIFNTLENIVINGTGMFIQDNADETTGPLGPEPSRRSFVIYNRKDFRRAYNNGRPYSDYLRSLERLYINPYTGTIISQGQ